MRFLVLNDQYFRSSTEAQLVHFMRAMKRRGWAPDRDNWYHREGRKEGGGANITPVESAPPGPEPEWCTCGWDEVSLFFRCKRCSKNAKGYVGWVEAVFGGT